MNQNTVAYPTDFNYYYRTAHNTTLEIILDTVCVTGVRSTPEVLIHDSYDYGGDFMVLPSLSTQTAILQIEVEHILLRLVDQRSPSLRTLSLVYLYYWWPVTSSRQRYTTLSRVSMELPAYNILAGQEGFWTLWMQGHSSSGAIYSKSMQVQESTDGQWLCLILGNPKTGTSERMDDGQSPILEKSYLSFSELDRTAF
jgi:hypothetical protein